MDKTVWFTTKTGGQMGVHRDNLTLTTVRPDRDFIEILIQSEWRYVHFPYEVNRDLVQRSGIHPTGETLQS